MSAVTTVEPNETRISSELWEGLSSKAVRTNVAKGNFLFREGSPVKGIYLLRKGRVRLSLGAKRKTLTYRIVGPPYILGLPATLLNRPYSLTAEVLENAEVAFVPARRVMASLGKNSEICLQALTFLSQEMVWIRQLQAAHLL